MKITDRDFGDYIEDVLKEIDFLEKYISIDSFKEVSTDEIKTRAFVRSLEVIGEASTKIPFKFKKKYPNISWNKLSEIRNELAHEYFSVNLEQLFNLIINKIIPLKTRFNKMLEELDR